MENMINDLIERIFVFLKYAFLSLSDRKYDQLCDLLNELLWVGYHITDLCGDYM